MNTTVKSIDACRKEIEIEVPKEVVAEEFERVFSDISKHANIKGFRKGKAPRNIVEEHYAEVAKEEVIKALIPQFYKKAIEKEKLTPASYPEISDVRLDGKLLFKVALDIRPEVKLKNYKGIKVKPSVVEVKEKEIEEALESMRKSYAGATQQDKEQKEKPQLPELDDNFAKKIGYQDLADLKSRIKVELLNISKGRSLEDQRHQVIQHLLAEARFEVPHAWVKEQLTHLLNNAKINLLMSGVKKEEVDSKIKERESEISKQAQDNVRTFFILEKIAEEENIGVTEEEVSQRVKTLALRQGIAEEQVKEYLDKRNMWDDLIGEIRQNKVIDFLLKESKRE